MIRIKFKNKNKELMFFKDLHFLSESFGYGIKYAEMVNDLDVKENEISQDKNDLGDALGDPQW